MSSRLVVSACSLGRIPSALRFGRVSMMAASTIHTAACLIIGDEVLGGKTVDTNSAYVAKWCFSLGIRLRRIEVVEDEEGEIVEAVRRMSRCYDFVVTSGGIGPTHDDITYQSIAKAFNLPLKLHQQAFEKMKRLSRPHPSQPDFSYDQDSPELRAKLRMVKLPTDEGKSGESQVLFPREDLLVDPEGKGSTRVLIATPLAESSIAGYLGELAARVEARGVKVGSYPRWGKSRNTVTLVGRDAAFIESLVAEVADRVQGQRVATETDEEEAGGGTDKDP
ncbi:hypothetical protein L249_4362 [Ophiocordyceps polyrhachis-furcata BCC 54312]|uniref:MoaB/Mog domain-containing protein n=1 Tax=Ophiocordyceps polyrhachis-furcata BCC 54312 TaxID=1330021 RepID=A0A367L7D9_9HYPO|nr:hypothetical protein L249_4362 [Ophiocordyceps polyrhachis-furcata BCC 54312]